MTPDRMMELIRTEQDLQQLKRNALEKQLASLGPHVRVPEFMRALDSYIDERVRSVTRRRY